MNWGHYWPETGPLSSLLNYPASLASPWIRLTAHSGTHWDTPRSMRSLVHTHRHASLTRFGAARGERNPARFAGSLRSPLAAHLHTLQALLTIPRRGEISRPRSLILSLPSMPARAHIERVGATARRRAPEHALPELGHVAVLGRLEVVVDVAVLFRAPVRQGDVPRDSVCIGIAKMLCLDTIWEVRKDVEDVGGCGRGRGWWKRSRVEVR